MSVGVKGLIQSPKNNRLLNPRELRYRMEIMKERDRLIKERKNHVFSGNRWRSSRNSGTT
jgi:hypothetical protein